MSDMREELKQQARDIFAHALEASRVAPVMEARIRFEGDALWVDSDAYRLSDYARVVVIATGKAAGVMAATFLRLAGTQAARMEAVVCGVGEMPGLPAGARVYRGGHPTPNEASSAAAEDVLRTLGSLTERDLAVFLVSGGGSALVEKFMREDATEAEVAATHRALVESGLPIAAMNVVRKHLSAVKGGRLAAAAAPAEQLTVLVSDVPAGELDALSSGPTLPDRSTVADVRRIVAQYGLESVLPKRVAAMLLDPELAETPKEQDAAFARSRWYCLLDSGSLAAAAAARAVALGWRVEIDNACDDWSAAAAAEYLVARLRQLRMAGERVCLLSAGEVTVRVPTTVAGRGGRNQHFALLCSQRIAGEEITVLSGGSDGIDGNSVAAGGVVDGSTLERAQQMGYPVEQALARFDSEGLLGLLDDTIVTGPTGNNLRDLRILLAP